MRRTKNPPPAPVGASQAIHHGDNRGKGRSPRRERGRFHSRSQVVWRRCFLPSFGGYRRRLWCPRPSPRTRLWPPRLRSPCQWRRRRRRGRRRPSWWRRSRRPLCLTRDGSVINCATISGLTKSLGDRRRRRGLRGLRRHQNNRQSLQPQPERQRQRGCRR